LLEDERKKRTEHAIFERKLQNENEEGEEESMAHPHWRPDTM
jgi:hypothetical protein